MRKASPRRPVPPRDVAAVDARCRGGGVRCRAHGGLVSRAGARRSRVTVGAVAAVRAGATAVPVAWATVVVAHVACPDWVCGVLSDSTGARDEADGAKRRTYWEASVAHDWIADLAAMQVSVYARAAARRGSRDAARNGHASASARHDRQRHGRAHHARGLSVRLIAGCRGTGRGSAPHRDAPCARGGSRTTPRSPRRAGRRTGAPRCGLRKPSRTRGRA
jgi:hypothetical protein